jgi:hypothetical protein
MRRFVIRKLLIGLLLCAALPAFSQNGAISGHCTLGGTQATVSGLNSSNYLQGIIPGCTVTVYLTGTTTLATITNGQGNANPFTANSAFSTDPGGWSFYASISTAVDVVGSGGTSPNTYPSPVTLLMDVFPGQQSAGCGNPGAGVVPIGAPTGSGCTASSLSVSGATASGTNASFSGTVTTPKAILTQPGVTWTSAVAFGDSITEGGQDSTPGDPNSWPYALSQLTGKTVLNAGIYGQTSRQIYARANAFAGTVNQQASVTANTLPASGGTVTITFSSGYEPAYNQHLAASNGPYASGIPITLCGANGNVTESGGVYTFHATSGAGGACGPNAQWVPNLSGITGTGVLEIFAGGFNDYSINHGAQVLASTSAAVTAATARYQAGQSAGYMVVGYPASNSASMNYTLYPNTAYSSTVNPTFNAMAGTYGSNFLNITAYLAQQANGTADNIWTNGPGLQSLPGGGTPTNCPACTWYGGGVPASLYAFDLSGSITAPLGATGCPTSYGSITGNSSALSNFGSLLYFSDNGEIIYLADAYNAWPTLATNCVRGYNGTTAASHLNNATFQASDGIHPSSVARAWLPPKGGLTGYQTMAAGIYAALPGLVAPAANIILPNNNALAITSADGTKSAGFTGAGFTINAPLAFSSGCTNCPLGSPSNPATGIDVNSNAAQAINFTGVNGQQFVDSGLTGSLLSPQFALTFKGTSGYTSTNTAGVLATTTSGAGTGMELFCTAAAGILNACQIAANGSGYLAGDKVYPTCSGSSGDGYITILQAAGTTLYGPWLMNGSILPGVNASLSIGNSNSPLSGLVAFDAGSGNIVLAAQGTKIQSGAGNWAIYADVPGHGFIGGVINGSGTYPGLGGTGTFRMGPIRTLGQATGDQSLTNANGGAITDDATGWKVSPQIESSAGVAILPTGTGQTSGKVIGTCGAATQFGPCSLAATDMPSTGTWYENGSTQSGAGTAFVQNQTVFYAFPVRSTITATAMVIRWQTADNTANVYSVAIYNSTGSTLLEYISGAGTTLAPSTGIKNFAWHDAGTLTLTPGTYLFAYTTNCAASCAVLNNNNVNILSPFSGSAGGATSSGLPASSITPGGSSWTNALGTFPWFALHN